MASELVNDPVGHISISGVHGGDELLARTRNARPQSPAPMRGPTSLTSLLVAAALGAAVSYLLNPSRTSRTSS
jgi:hypothetical protein